MMMRLSDPTTGYERSSSHISIYNYPDHLNPFYDDDNHKRLRFWNLLRRNDTTRRRSFSIGHLRDVWSFKSFSSKKKSSTLGINKTSESPPILRRNLDSTYASQRETSSINRRPMTTSLQDINTSYGARSSDSSILYNYHDNTQSNGRQTPQFQRNQAIRSSYTSLSSTNPFESDVESDFHLNGSATGGTSRKSYRKKRRAPSAPPKNEDLKVLNTPVNERSTDNYQSSQKAQVAHNMDIKSLTVEIENFVNRSDISDNTTLSLESSTSSGAPQTQAKIIISSLSTAENNKTDIDQKDLIHDPKVNTTEEITIPKVEHISKYEQVTINPQVHKINNNQTNHITLEKRSSQNNNVVKSSEYLKKPLTIVENSQSVGENINTVIVDQRDLIHDPSHVNTNEEIAIPNEELISKREQVKINSEVYKIYNNQDNNTTFEKRSLSENNNIFERCTYMHEPLTILENTPSVGENINTDNVYQKDLIRDPKSNTTGQTAIPNEEHIFKSELVRISPHVDKINNNQVNHIKFEKRSLRKNNNNNIVERCEYLNEPLTILENSAPVGEKPAKAKSVKEIIDSINRSQQLLKESAAKGTKVYSTNLYDKSKVEPKCDVNKSSHEMLPNTSSADSNMGNDVHLETDYFKKSKINKSVFQYRESSPTTSNLDWNPLPKPKRTNSDAIV